MPEQSRTLRGADRRRSASARGLRRVNREPAEPTLITVISIISAIVRPLTFRDWRGQEHIPRTGGVLLVANHISNVDPIAVGQYVAFAGRWPRFLAKASLFRLPVLGRVVRACGQIPVERGTGTAGQALRVAVEAIADGKAVFLYPEGTITLDPDLWPMRAKSGAARIALETGRSVIPIGQWGAQDIMYGKQIHVPRLLPRKTFQVMAGPPVRLDDLRDRPTTPTLIAEASDRIMDAITVLVSELRGETPPEHRLDPRVAENRGKPT
ncbi:MAG: 1-acyl-sn-glycerol-3-phosphate acyltransferase [Microlunatus sp.]|nr:1-acyl-sn-glycerol-3-phosphate acyltransferase [Microlunatus sp.]MDN5770085.1 1-acyl-sn-glycerol-3-phosphate acyltransferase [Microlunatus sp.]